MALNQFDGRRQYTKYTRHVDNAHEHVHAQTVNKLQDDLNTQQVETNLVKDTAFEERVYTIFENNLYANSMFLEPFRVAEYMNMNASEHIRTDFETTHLMLLKNPATNTFYPNGHMTSTVVKSPYGEAIEMNDFFLVADEYKPVGTNIRYFLQNYKGERWPLTPNALKLPMHLTEPLKYGFSVVVELQANALGESPVLNGYAVLYWDAGVEEALGMTNPDLARFPSR